MNLGFKSTFTWNTLFTGLTVVLLQFEMPLAKYQVSQYKNYKPKTDSVSYQDRAILFRRGLTTTKVGGYFAYLGTGFLLAGTLLRHENLLYAGAGTMAVGLPTIGFGSLYMKSSIHSEATFTPNGFPWYFTTLLAAGAYTYGLKKTNLTLAAQAGGGIIVGALTLTTWKKFAAFRNLMAKRYSEYTLSVTPQLNIAQSGQVSPGLIATLHF